MVVSFMESHGHCRQSDRGCKHPSILSFLLSALRLFGSRAGSAGQLSSQEPPHTESSGASLRHPSQHVSVEDSIVSHRVWLTKKGDVDAQLRKWLKAAHDVP